jgi:hypothetical protein
MSSPGGAVPRPDDPAILALVKEWSARPPTEVAAFAHSLESDPARPQPGPDAPGPDPRSLALDEVRALAAVSGAVRPGDLVRGEPDPARRSQLLGALAAEFDRAVVDGRMTWTMRSMPRSQVLGRLRAGPSGLSAAVSRAAGVATDAAGEVLRRLIPGVVGGLAGGLAGPLPPGVGRVPADVVAGASSAEVAQALLWVSDLADVRAGIAWATCRAHVESIRDSYVGLLAHGLVGREEQRREVEDFLMAPPVAGWPPVPVLTLSGIGGAGKSTLLAGVCAPRLDALLSGLPAPAVVVIDLDRVAFRPHAEVELGYEVTRQLELAWPELAQGLAEARAAETQARIERRELASGASPDPETSQRSYSAFEGRVHPLVSASVHAFEPVTLVLDTFEEWQRARPFSGPRTSWNDPEPVMADWLFRLRDGMGLSGLRVIVSGRARFAALPGHEVELGELGQDAATELLRRLGVADDDAPRLAGLVGGNPLSLHVAARFVGRLATPDREAFLSSDGIDPALDEELRRAVLYDRFLEHIGDDRVQQLAHPGLALRRVTPQLVRDVLAEPCGFTDLDEEEAERLVDRLADEVWLVRRAEDGSLHHQPEVRRAMLSLMSGDPALRERVREIHERAARWYNPVPDLMEDATPEVIEAFYHRMMLATGEPPVFEGEWESAHGRVLAERNHHARLARELGESVSEMAPQVEAQLRLLRGDRLTPEQARLLPAHLWSDYVATQGAALLEVGEADDAVDLFRTREWGRSSSVPQWLPQAYSDSAQWAAYVAEVGAHPTTSGDPSDRYDVLCRFLSGDVDARAGLRAMRPPDGSDREQTFVGTFVTALARAAEGIALDGLEQPLYDAKSLTTSALYPVDQLRQYVLHRLTGVPLGRREGDAVVVGDVAGLFVPDPDVMLAFGAVLADAERDLLEISADLRSLADRARLARGGSTRGPRTHDVLGERATEVSKRLRGKLRLTDGPLGPAAQLALRGDNPELRPAVRHELVAAAPDDTWLKHLGELATSLLPVPALDLRPDAMPLLSEPTARTAVVTLVEYVDRSRVTRAFLHAAQQAHPRPAELDRIVRAFDRWDDTHALLLEELGRFTSR